MTDINYLLEHAGISQDRVDAARDIESIFLSYSVQGRTVHVEVIAPNLAEALLKFSAEEQARVIAVLLNLVPKVGNKAFIVDEHDGGKKRRSARVIRIRSERDEDISLLITR